MRIRLEDNSVIEVNLFFAEDGTKKELIDATSELKISK